MTTESDQRKGSDEDAAWLGRLPVAAGVIMALLLFTYAWTFSKLPVGENPAAWGTFGDYMGGLLNPLISLFTLIVAVQVWRLQKTELLETRKAVEEQGKTAEQQRREQRFFDLMAVLQRVEDSIVSSDEKFHGKRAIRAYRFELGNSVQQTIRYGLGQTVDSEQITETVLKREWDEHAKKTPLISYLRVLSRVLSDAENLLGERPHQHINLLKSQLSDDEIIVISLAIWLDPEWESLKKLVCEYSLLEYLSAPGLRKELQGILPGRAFGDSALNQPNATA